MFILNFQQNINICHLVLGYLGAAVATSCVCMHVGVVAAREARSLPPAVAALILMAVLSLVAAPMATQVHLNFALFLHTFIATICGLYLVHKTLVVMIFLICEEYD